MKSYELTVTPDKAAELLRTVKNNRPLNQGWVATLSRDMESGRFRQLSPQGLILDEDGNIMDGQHRCAACVKSGKTIAMWVTQGADWEIMPFLDGGKIRKVSDRLHIDGVNDAVKVASVARLVFHWKAGFPVSTNVSPSYVELKALVESDQDVVAAARFAHSWEFKPLPPSLAGMAYYLFRKLDESDAAQFMAELQYGAGLEKGSPAHYIRERLISGSTGNSVLPPKAKMALVIQGWNRFRKNDGDVRGLHVRSGLTNTNFPRPI
jgi:hypothetical protein